MPKWVPVNNDVTSVADWIAYVSDQVISQVTSATRPSPGATGEFIYETDTSRLMGQNGAGFVGFGGLTSSAWTSHSFQLDQGASTNITRTSVYSQWMRFGNVALWQFTATVSAAGTAGSQVTVSSPFTLSTSAPALGAGLIYDASTTTRYSGTWIPSSTTQLRLFVSVVGAAAWGQTPNLALASGDGIHGSVWLPIA